MIQINCWLNVEYVDIMIRCCDTVCVPLAPGSPLSPLDEDIIRAGNIGQGYENSHFMNMLYNM